MVVLGVRLYIPLLCGFSAVPQARTEVFELVEVEEKHNEIPLGRVSSGLRNIQSVICSPILATLTPL